MRKMEGGEMPQYRSMLVEPKDGLNVELSIDRIIQGIVEEELRTIVGTYDPLSAVLL